MRIRNFPPLLLLTILLATFSCKNKLETASKEEALQFAKEMEASVTKGDEEFLNTVFDEISLRERINANLKSSKKISLKEMHSGLLSAKLGKQIIDNIEKNGSYELVRAYEKNNTQHLIFRLFGDGAINYHDYELVKRDGKIKAGDMFIYISGNNMSELMASGLMAFDDIKSDETDRQLAAMREIRSLMARKKFAEAKNRFDDIPAPLKDQNVYQVIYIQICKEIDDSTYTQALTHYSKLFPDAPNASLLQIDASVIHKNYPEALVAINKLDSIVGKDPMLNYYRGLMYKLMENQDSSLLYFEALHRNMPAFISADPELLKIYLDKKEYDKAKAIYLVYKNDRKADKTYLETVLLLHPDFKKIVDHE